MRGDAVLPRFCRYFLTRASASAHAPYSSSSSPRRRVTTRTASAAPIVMRHTTPVTGWFNQDGASWLNSRDIPAIAGIPSAMTRAVTALLCTFQMGIMPTSFFDDTRCGLSAPQATKHLAWRRSAVSDPAGALSRLIHNIAHIYKKVNDMKIAHRTGSS